LAVGVVFLNNLPGAHAPGSARSILDDPVRKKRSLALIFVVMLMDIIGIAFFFQSRPKLCCSTAPLPSL
jgi:hypothetical protein